jgi:hypothetical protein
MKLLIAQLTAEPQISHSLNPLSFLLLSDGICVDDTCMHLMGCIGSESRQTNIDYKK